MSLVQYVSRQAPTNVSFLHFIAVSLLLIDWDNERCFKSKFSQHEVFVTKWNALSSFDITSNSDTVENKKAVLPQGNRAMLQVFFPVEVRQTHSLQV